MPSTKEIRMKIKSVNNTRKITNAMQMVAASKMRKAQVRMAQEFVRLFRTLQPPIRTTIIRSSLRTMTPKKSVLS